MQFQACIPDRLFNGPVLIHFTLFDDLDSACETQSSLTVEVTPALIQELRLAADSAERALAKRKRELAIRAAVMAEEGA